MKVLLSAYACEPEKGSEPAIGWNVARELAKYYDIWVLTSNCHRSGIEAELAHNPLPNLHFVYFDPFSWVLDWSQDRKTVQWGVQLHYYLWQIWAYFVVRKLHSEINFDLAHHVTYVQYARPSFISLLPIPFLWGSVGGGESAPKAFWQDFSLRGKIYESLRSLARWVGEHDPFVRLTARQSILAWATTEDTATRLRYLGAKNVQVYPAIALPKDELEICAEPTTLNSSPVRFISVGRFLHWKGFDLGVRAFAQSNLSKEVQYWLVGDGVEQQTLEELTIELGIAQSVKFWGKLSREETLQKLRECHVLVHPSLHDSGGGVCLEAMAAGLPVICLDLGGPSLQVTRETGFKIQAHTPEQAVSELATAMNCLAKDSELRSRMGRAGQHRIRESFVWESKGQFLASVYQDILNKTYPQAPPLMLDKT
ncbi:glycosyltransferase [Aetokthonos hydrillicola Thurmond2011]|jgi:glycosyltransferase involved in cell wall biosynthesis|uniref:Glycosyltransferase n=1 Tax=Aetokthonos hydrillicola Thurmond2011 TaxID=2712845 RepID=A0AAP5M8H1_9CYAN|nr:glycosyltransferase [Aetokthonos hydrillicola]MBO3457596.1 glycosyltransferase [Aetokthonos hydrillicola CCALA 1050]MBW4587874.1 glycosyltransferase [Aetokthonos hydrillicola CCALA 1050]MDR9894722.1 glycosyltransferase [Aetokthonos hydrillicola Thurmond2011]